jgi:dipeptidyl aminopeptidase/acylaminoacyl peptidase
MWLVYPPGFDPKKKYPVMHNIHGGPHTAAGDNWHYRWNTQVFAAQGYVVASVNYHGSTSFGYAFLDSITTAGANWNCRTSRPAPTGC